MNQRLGTFLALVVALVAGGLLVLGLFLFTPSGGNDARTLGTGDDEIPLTDPTLWADFRVPEFELTSHEGREVSRSDVIGDGEHYLVMDFFFSNCELVCPLMNANMLMASNQLDGYDVRFLSMSVDPRNDTAEKLRAHAAALGADTDRWTFLTGEPGEVAEIVAALGFAQIEDDPAEENLIELEDGSTMANIIHPSRFLVLDPEGNIVGAYRGTERAEVQEMIQDLKQVLALRG
jgi:protein SCO1/2